MSDRLTGRNSYSSAHSICSGFCFSQYFRFPSLPPGSLAFPLWSPSFLFQFFSKEAANEFSGWVISGLPDLSHFLATNFFDEASSFSPLGLIRLFFFCSPVLFFFRCSSFGLFLAARDVQLPVVAKSPLPSL